MPAAVLTWTLPIQLTAPCALVVSGPDRVKFLQGQLTGDIAAIEPGGFARACMTTPKGRMRALLNVLNRGNDFILLSDEHSHKALLEHLGRMAPLTDCVVRPEELETVRVESGIPRWGAEMDEECFPLELGLDDAVSFSKGCYMGQETLAHIKNRGHLNRILRGVLLSGPASVGTELLGGDTVAGRLTSVVFSKKAGSHLGLSLIKSGFETIGTELKTKDGLNARVVGLPL